MKQITIFLVFVCSVLSTKALAQNIGQCNGEEIRRVAAETERAVLDRVRADMRAEGRVMASALGVNDQDCLSQASQKAQWIRHQAIDQCVSQTTYFRTCAIQDQRVVGVPQRIQPLGGNGHFDEKKTDENTCRTEAQNRAIQDALNRCQDAFGIGCRIVAGPSPATHQTEHRRRYGIAGPKDEYHICTSTAHALPNTSAQIQCSVELIARAQF